MNSRYKQLSTTSNNDYSSSSEQSCDTVIYNGPNGKQYIKNESSDNEINERKQHRFNFKRKITSNEIWIDGPKEQQQQQKIIENTREIWIDGPNVNSNCILKTGENKGIINQNSIENVNRNKEEMINNLKDPQISDSSNSLINSYFNAIRETIEQSELISSSTDCNNNNDDNNRRLSLKSSESSESLECLDRVLLKQLNQQAFEMFDSAEYPSKLNPNSRPISLLSVNSNNNPMNVNSNNNDKNTISDASSITSMPFNGNCENGESCIESENSSKNSSMIDLSCLNNEEIEIEEVKQEESECEPTITNNIGYNTLPNIKANNPNEDDVTFKRKLDDLKTSYDQMIFKQSQRDIESLHKTLESMLGVNSSSLLHNNHEKNTSSSILSKMSEQEKDKRLSRILSPTRLPSRNYFNTHKINTNELTKSTNVFQAPNIINPINSSSAFPMPALQPTINQSEASLATSIKPPANDQYSEPFDNLLVQCQYANNKSIIGNDKQATNLMIVNNKRINSFNSNHLKLKLDNCGDKRNTNNNLVSLPTSPAHNSCNYCSTSVAIANQVQPHVVAYASSSCLTQVQKPNSTSVPSTPFNMRKSVINENTMSHQHVKLLKNKENKQPQANKFVNLIEQINRKSSTKSKQSLDQSSSPSKNNQQPKESILQRLFRSKSKDKPNKKLQTKISAQVSKPIVKNSAEDYNKSFLTSPNASLKLNKCVNHSTPIHNKEATVHRSVIISSSNNGLIQNQAIPYRHRISVSDNSSVFSCELNNSNNIIDYGVHSLVGASNSSTSSAGAASSSSGYESMNRDSNDSDNASTNSKLKPS